MKRWAPVPWEFIRQADRARFDADHPALDVIGYLLIWGDLVDGTVRSSREIANHLGWSRHRVRRVIARVKSDHATWIDPERDHRDLQDHSAHFSPKPAQSRPAAVTIPDTCDDNSPNVTKTRPSRARDLHIHTNIPSSTCRIAVTEIWNAVGKLRAKHIPGCRQMTLTPARRQQIQARATEHGEESIVEVWRWALTSSHQRAVYLRESGFVKPGTLHRPGNFADYLDIARTKPTPQTTQVTEPVANLMREFLRREM